MPSSPCNHEIAVALELGDAGELAAAWLSALAERCGCRVLIIKGPTLEHHGIRPPRISADIDVLVDPRDFEKLGAAIVLAGWRPRPATEVGAVWAAHSLSFLNDGWPCDIDVHRYFPGFFSNPTQVFERLWADRERIDLAHRPVPIPNRSASLLIAALHQLRDGQTRADKSELAIVRSIKLDELERKDLVSLAVETGAVEPLRDLLLSLGVNAREIPPARDSAELRGWRARIDADASGAFYWLLLLERTPFAGRAGVAMRAIWPPRQDLLINNPETRDTRLGRTLVRLSRLPKGLRGLPRAVRAVRARTTGGKRDPAATRLE